MLIKNTRILDFKFRICFFRVVCFPPKAARRDTPAADIYTAFSDRNASALHPENNIIL